MKGKSVLYALAVVVLMGTMAGAALAGDHGKDMYGSSDPLLSADPEGSATQWDTGGIREPMETGAVPDRSESSSGLDSNAGSDEPTVEFGGVTFRPIDIGS